MRGSHPKAAPELFMDWLAKKSRAWQPTYSNLQSPEKDTVVDALWDAQRGLCVYCGRKLSRDRPETYHIEHFRPQSAYPELGTSFANLFLSCGQGRAAEPLHNLCGAAKANWFDEERHVEPDYPCCTDRFRFGLTGEIMPARQGDEAAQEMIDRLNLNHPELELDREDILWEIDAGKRRVSDFIPSSGRGVSSYAHRVGQRYGRVIP